jgi:hypothetical protein
VVEVFGRHAQRDHDLGERVALLETFGSLEAVHALIVDHGVQSRAFEAPHRRDADAETLGDVIARERCQFQFVLRLFCDRSSRLAPLRAVEDRTNRDFRGNYFFE